MLGKNLDIIKSLQGEKNDELAFFSEIVSPCLISEHVLNDVVSITHSASLKFTVSFSNSKFSRPLVKKLNDNFFPPFYLSINLGSFPRVKSDSSKSRKFGPV